MDKKRRKSRIRRNGPLFIALIAIVLYVSWIFLNQQIKLKELMKEEESLKKQVAELKLEEQRLIEEKKMLDDPKYIEKVARERLKMVKPNEIIYIDQEKAKFQD